MTLMRNKSAAPQAVVGAGEAQPGGALEVPDHLAAGLTGPGWEPAAAAAPEPDPAPAVAEFTPTAPEDEDFGAPK